MGKRKQREQLIGSIQGLVEGAACTFRELAEELTNWADNMPENLQGGDKHSTLQDSASTLESAADELENLDFECADGTAEVTYSPLSGRRSGRAARNGQACYELEAAMDAIQAEIDNLEATLVPDAEEGSPAGDANDATQSKIDDLEELRSNIDNAKSDAENVEFPGLYG